MAYASKAGRARTSATRPQAHAICDRCGFRWNHADLSWNFDWRGAALQNTRILVCRRCLDKPQEQLRAIVLPSDPDPIINARIEPYACDEIDNMTLTPSTTNFQNGVKIPNATQMTTVSGSPMNRQPLGAPGPDIKISNSGIDQNSQMSPVAGLQWRQRVPFLSITVNQYTVTVTCSPTHGLSTGSQIAVIGLSDTRACGAFSVTVTSPVAFTYQIYDALPYASLVGPSVIMVTIDAGIPLGFGQIPQTGAA